jgi:hypothetical protein
MEAGIALEPNGRDPQVAPVRGIYTSTQSPE